jgi:chorismate mutase
LIATAGLAAPTHETLDPLADVSAERVQIADLVAAAKFGTTSPIDDPAREQAVLDAAAARSVELGIDPEVSKRVFRDQIEANKLVQRALFERWTAHPDEAPKERPDLAKEVRPKLDRITTQLLDQLRDTQRIRKSLTCKGFLVVAYVRADYVRSLDTLHERGLRRALESVCP